MSLPPHTQPTYPLPPQQQRPKNRLLLIIGIAAAAVVLFCGGLVALSAVGRGLSDNAAERNPALANPTFGAPAPQPTLTLPAAPTVAPTTAPASTTSAAPEMLRMPDVVGKNAAVAQDELTRAGFRVQLGSSDRTERYVVFPENWTVAEQSTAAGETISSDTLVVLTCEKGA